VGEAGLFGPETLTWRINREGVLVAGGGPILRLTPPLVISERQALAGVSLLDDALAEVEAGPEAA